MITYLMLIDGEEDRKKFEVIYCESRMLLFNIAIKIVKVEMEAENVVHETFVKIAERFDKYAQWPKEDIIKLSVTIVKNLSIDYLRKQKHYCFEELDNLVLYNTYIEFEPEEMINKDQEEKNIFELLQKLPEIYKQILELKYYHNMSNKEIGNILDIKPKTVEVRLFRARNKLRELIENER